jgi:Leucine-rich repeat (LRR) protein
MQCAIQGIELADFERLAPTIRQVDIFQPVEFESWALGTFTALEDLCIVQAPKFGRMPTLHSVRLETLTLVECGIKRLEGLESCVNLRRLCVDGNSIVSLSGLEPLTNLTHLHCNDNRLASLAGVSNCTHLKELWAASNQISSIGGSMDGLTELETLCLADNALGTFQVGP